jgi:hypothetical protein
MMGQGSVEYSGRHRFEKRLTEDLIERYGASGGNMAEDGTLEGKHNGGKMD